MFYCMKVMRNAINGYHSPSLLFDGLLAGQVGALVLSHLLLTLLFKV
jgi:hypothetical protein